MTRRPWLTLDDVTHRYGSTEALSHVTLALGSGQVTALLGPNGAGKTTIVRLLTGLARPTLGTATLFGGNPRDASARRRLGVMLQVGRVAETLTVREHVRLFSAYYRAPLPLDVVLQLSGLKAIAGRRFGYLSGGERQRVLFALAICGNPTLLFLDEPSVGMDVESRQRFWSTIRALAESGRPILLTTHHLEEADALATRIVVLNRGRVIADGTPARSNGRPPDARSVAGRGSAHALLQSLPGVHRVVDEAGRCAAADERRRPNGPRSAFGRRHRVRSRHQRDAGLEDAFLALTAADQENVHVA